MTLELLREFLGWCTLINIGLLAVSSLALITMRRFIAPLHAKMFGLNENQITDHYFRYLAQFKVLVIVFNLVPWIALSLMTCAICK